MIQVVSKKDIFKKLKQFKRKFIKLFIKRPGLIFQYNFNKMPVYLHIWSITKTLEKSMKELKNILILEINNN